MKKIYCIILTLCLSLAGMAQKTLHLEVGAGMALSNYSLILKDNLLQEGIGAGANLKFVLFSDNHRFSLSPSFSHFPARKYSFINIDGEAVTTYYPYSIANLDVRYAFIKKEKLSVMALAGPGILLDYGYFQPEGYDKVDMSDTSLTVNLGLAVNYPLTPKLKLYGETCYSGFIDDLFGGYLFLQAGLAFQLF